MSIQSVISLLSGQPLYLLVQKCLKYNNFICISRGKCEKLENYYRIFFPFAADYWQKENLFHLLGWSSFFSLSFFFVSKRRGNVFLISYDGKLKNTFKGYVKFHHEKWLYENSIGLTFRRNQRNSRQRAFFPSFFQFIDWLIMEREMWYISNLISAVGVTVFC